MRGGSSELSEDSPVPLDLVLVLDTELVGPIGRMRPADWFVARDRLCEDYPGGFKSTSWEVIPGLAPTTLEYPFADENGQALYVFASYLSAEMNEPFPIDDRKTVQLFVGTYRVELVEDLAPGNGPIGGRASCPAPGLLPTGE